MIKKLTGYLDYGLFAEVALVIFAMVFIAVVIRTLMMRTDDTRKQAMIVLDEGLPVYGVRTVRRQVQKTNPNANEVSQ
jgi:hypothetical protein